MQDYKLQLNSSRVRIQTYFKRWCKDYEKLCCLAYKKSTQVKKNNNKKARVVIVISNQIDFRAKNLSRMKKAISER